MVVETYANLLPRHLMESWNRSTLKKKLLTFAYRFAERYTKNMI